MVFNVRLPRRELSAIVASLVCITALSWYYLFFLAGNMPIAASSIVMQPAVWDVSYYISMFFMWAIMMVGMMTPSVAPAVLIYAGVVRKARSRNQAVTPTGFFLAGYLVIWVLFSVAATSAQWGLASLSLVSPMMSSSNNWLSAGILIVAGVYQWLPIKNQCLSNCRSPLEFVSQNWKKGYMGALRMGMHHGMFCVGCCWALMVLLFVGGVMNLLWIAIIAVYVLVEKLFPFGDHIARVMGAAMIVGAIYLIIS